MNSPDQVKMHVRNAGLLILVWGLAQAMMFFPNVTYTPNPDGLGGTWHLNSATGLANTVCGIGLFRWSRSARWIVLILARLRVIGCCLDMLEWLMSGLTFKNHVLDPMPLVVQQMVMGPFLLAQAYIIWVLTRDEVIARFERRVPPPVPREDAASGHRIASQT